MNRLLLLALGLASFAFGHTAESAGAPPSSGLDPAVTAVLQTDGVRIKDGARNVMELWFRKTAPTGTKNAEDNVTIPEVPQGTLLGVVRLPEKGSDRRGQPLKPGVYTMRLGFFPPDGNHQGAAPQRDFLVLTPAAEDKDVSATPKFDALMDMSRKASGTAHPAVLSLWKVDAASFKPGIASEGEHDWVLQHKIGDLPVALIVAGTATH